MKPETGTLPNIVTLPDSPSIRLLKPQRKIVQIATTTGTDYIHCGIVALCDDGTLWTKNYATNEWIQDVNIPQPEEDAK